MESIRELLLPRTDGGAIAQAVVVLLLLAVALAWTRDRPDARLLTIGLGIVAVALVGLRAAH